MHLSHDHYYDHVSRYIVDHNITWPDCAPCCTVWSTMLVYPLEAPYGEGRNLMAPILGGGLVLWHTGLPVACKHT